LVALGKRLKTSRRLVGVNAMPTAATQQRIDDRAIPASLKMADEKKVLKGVIKGSVLRVKGSVLSIDKYSIRGTFLFMARKLRIQYEGAVYHVMNRGDHRVRLEGIGIGAASEGGREEDQNPLASGAGSDDD
jgi:hypothetical protein